MMKLNRGRKDAWAIVDAGRYLVVQSGQLPVYWIRRVATEEARAVGGTVVRVSLYWNPDADLGFTKKPVRQRGTKKAHASRA